MIISRLPTTASLAMAFAAILACVAFSGLQARAQNCVVFGSYSSLPAVAYTCGSINPPLQLVSFNYSAWMFTTQGGSTLRVTGSPAGTPPALQGTLNCADSTFVVGAGVPGGCTETYSLQGRFSTDTSWSGTFSVTFTGSGCSTTNCMNQTFPVSGTTPRVTGLADAPRPAEASLGQNFPNPFNPVTTLGFVVPGSSHVALTIYNMLGQEIKILVDGMYPAGERTVVWDSRDNEGRPVSSGVYWYRLELRSASDAEPYVQTRKMLLLR